ncbi:MAG: sulfotransferase family protein [Myxococcales bacterium]|nr:sulfotransferase family protein [Myxococcales bacterium]
MSFLTDLFGLKPAPQGEPIVLVSGLPRSGTSMMMKMLEAGGIQVMEDGVRTADVDNPKGYYEYERVKHLEKETDKSYLKDARGKVIKIISFLLKDLPPDNDYRIVFMRRDLDEVLASQNKMLQHRNETDTSDDAAMREAYLNHIASVRIMSRKKANWQTVEIRYDDTVKSPAATAAALNAFLGGKLDEKAMVAAVDGELYRNRKDKLKGT